MKIFAKAQQAEAIRRTHVKLNLTTYLKICVHTFSVDLPLYLRCNTVPSPFQVRS